MGTRGMIEGWPRPIRRDDEGRGPPAEPGLPYKGTGMAFRKPLRTPPAGAR